MTIFYGRRLYGLWIGFEAFLLGERLASFALYRSTDLLRFSVAALIGLLFALLALRFHRHVLALGGFLSAGVLGLLVTGRFLPIVPGWVALVALVAAGSLGGLFVWRNLDLGTIILSAVSGTLAAMTILRRFTGSNLVLEPLVFITVAGLGIWFQMRQWRRSGSPAMAKKRPRLLFFLLALLLAGCTSQLPGDIPQDLTPGPLPTVAPKARPELTLKPDDRILVLAPHPDDETLSSGGLKITPGTGGSEREHRVARARRPLDRLDTAGTGEIRGRRNRPHQPGWGHTGHHSHAGAAAAGRLKATAYLFGYRDDRPFAEMPKLHVEIRKSCHKLYDAGKLLKDASVQVTSNPKRNRDTGAAGVVGRPQRVLLGLRVQTGQVPLESEPWHVPFTGG